MAILTFELEDDMARALEAAAREYHLAPEDLMRQLVWAHLASRQPEDSYDAWLLRSTQEAMREIKAGNVIPGEVVEAHFAARRAATLRKLAEEACRSSGHSLP